jgi:hypothetical protein
MQRIHLNQWVDQPDHHRMKDFREWGCAVSPTFKFWDMFLLAASNMLQNIRAEINGVWSMHLSSVRSMLPFFFGETAHPHSRKSFIRGARCASNKEFRTAISSFHEDISPVKVSWHLRRASQNRYVCQWDVTSIEKLWDDGDLADLLVDSCAYASCTVEQMLSGKQFKIGLPTVS